MLIRCPECELQVSDKAMYCPHCGFPIVSDKPQKNKPTKKHKRLPNGFGQIIEIKNRNLRKPYRAMVTVGKNEYGKPIQKILKPDGYFKTYNDAYQALMEYNKSPYDLEDDITMSKLYDRWTKVYFATLKTDGSVRNIKAAWNKCGDLYNIRAKDIRARHIKAVMNQENISPNMAERVKSLFNLMLDYAVEYEIVDKNYARTFNVSSEILEGMEEAKRSHISFTDKEMKLLWENINMPYVDVVLIQCYSGWRPQELGLIRLENVDIDNWSFIGGIKTDAGFNRFVPIHPQIRDLVKARYDEAININSEYLINCTDGTTHRSSIKFTYDKYRHRFDKIISILKLNPDHRPHDGRKQFVTMAKKYKVDEWAIKRLIGHSINDLTEKTYTDRNEDWLGEEIEKIPMYE